MARGLGRILPGFPQLVGGRWVEGGTAIFLWVGLLTLAVVRFDRVVGAFSMGTEGVVALVALLGGLGMVWFWSQRDLTARVREERPGEEGSVLGAGGPMAEAFRRNRLAVLGVAIVLVVTLAALLAPFLAPFDPKFQGAYQGDGTGLGLAPPSLRHPMGTDVSGRDIFSRVLYGARISLSIGLLAVGISVSIGTFLGAVAGYFGGILDTLIMRFVDMVMAFPRLVLLLAIVALFPQPSIFLILTALALTQWPFTTRVVRGEMLSLKEREFAEAARALGFSRSRIIFRHLLPNAMAPVIVLATLGIGNTIVLEAGLSFLGLGVQPPTPSWGSMVGDGRDYLTSAWWVATFPGLAIVLVVLAFNLVGDGLRDALDPRQQTGGRT